MKKYLQWTLVLALAVALVAVSANCSSGEEEEATYKVGAVFSTTGPASNLGVPEKNTVNMIVDQVNADGGINGHPLEVIVYDDATDAEQCVARVTTLIEQDEVIAIVGPTTSGNSLAILDTVTNAEIPLVSCAASTKIIEPVEDRYWIFKTPQTDKQAVTEIYTLIQQPGLIMRIAIITATSGFGVAGKDLLVELAPDYNIEIVDQQEFDEGDTSMTSQLTHIKGTDAGLVICWATDKESAQVAVDMQTLEMDIPLFCSHGIANQAFIDAAGEAANGVRFPAGKLLIVNDLPDSDPQKPVLLQYIQDYEAIYGNGTINTFGGHAWDALQMVVDALEELPVAEPYSTSDWLDNARSAVRDNIEQTANFIGISGIFTMSADNHLGMLPGSLAMIEIVDQKWTHYEP